MKITFMGTPDFAATALQRLIASHHTVGAVYTQPPRPAKRGHQVQKSAVHLLAENHHMPVHTPTSLKDEKIAGDVAVVVAYGLILPHHILKGPTHGCLNIHASLLPRWRGAAPIQRAIEAGDTKTGITTMQMDKGLDTGDILLQTAVAITPEATAQTLHNELADAGANLILETLEQLEKLTPTPQNEAEATYAHKLTKEEGKIDWSKPAEVLERKIRAFTPWPGCYFVHDNEQIKVLAAEVVDQTGTPGKILAPPLIVGCGNKSLRILTLQRPGKSPLPVEDFLRGTPLYGPL